MCCAIHSGALDQAFSGSKAVWKQWAGAALKYVGDLDLNREVLFKGTSGYARALPPVFHAQPPVPAWVFPPEYAYPADWSRQSGQLPVAPRRDREDGPPAAGAACGGVFIW